MTRMQDVETTIRHYDTFVAATRFLDERQQRVELHESSSALPPLVQRRRNFARRDRSDADLANHQAGRDIRQRR